MWRAPVTAARPTRAAAQASAAYIAAANAIMAACHAYDGNFAGVESTIYGAVAKAIEEALTAATNFTGIDVEAACRAAEDAQLRKMFE